MNPPLPGSAPRRVAIVISHMNMGGAQRQLLNLIRALDPERWRATLICFGPATDLSDALSGEGHDVRFVRKRGRIDPTLLIRLAAELRRIRPDVVHTVLRTANLWGRTAAILAGIRHIVASERSSAYRTGFAVRAWSRWLGRRTDLVTVNSRAGVAYAARHHAHVATRIAVVGNGVALPDLSPGSLDRARAALRGLAGFPADRRIVAIVGNLLPEKELEDAVELAARLIARGDGASPPASGWVVFGEGPDRPRLEAAIASRLPAGSFKLLGHRSDLGALLPGADVLLQTSSREGLPNAVLEGMAAGLPVVATDVGGTSEALGGSGTAGVLVPVHGLDEMAAALSRVNPGMGAAGRLRIERDFSIGAMARATERLWEERCLDAGPNPRVLVVVSRYSRRSTFIERELSALRAGGVDMTIVSLLPPEAADGRIAPDSCIEDGAIYLPFVPGPGHLGDACDALSALVSHPLRAAAGLGAIILGQLSSPRVLVRSAAVFPKMLMIAGRARRIRAGAIHAHWATISATAGMTAARVAGLPFSFSGHAWDLYFDTALLPDKLRAARFVAVCNAHSAAMLREQYPESAVKVRRLYHGLDLSRFDYQPFGPPDPRPRAPGAAPLRILAIGRLVQKKGFDALITACGLLERAGVRVECVIRGEGGPEEARLRAMIASEAPGLVRIEGYLPEKELVAEMRRYDLLAAPSIVQTDGAMDGIPNVVIESMAIGLPVVTTAVAGLPEIAEDGRTALVVPGSDPAALALAIRRLAEEPGLAARLAASARETIERQFDIRATARELAGLLAGEASGADTERAAGAVREKK